MTTLRALAAFSALLALPLATPGIAQPTSPTAAPVPGAMPNDKTMTCDMIGAERIAINETVAQKAANREKSAKVKRGLFGFAKTMATAMVPGASLLAGGSMLGSMAAQGAGQSAVDALSKAGGPSATPVAPQPTTEQAARLARLDTISTYRQCAG